MDPRELRKLRRSRRHPRPTKFDCLHLRCLVRDLALVLEHMDDSVGGRSTSSAEAARTRTWCRSRLDTSASIENDHYGVADVVSDEFLPFPTTISFMCTEAFEYVPDPAQGIAEIKRVLYPGGRVDHHRFIRLAVPLHHPGAP